MGLNSNFSDCAHLFLLRSIPCPSALLDWERTVVINDIVINGVNQNEAHVEAGSEVALTMTGSLTNNNTSCPGCFTQSYARINGVMNLCLANTGGNASINASTTFTAPHGARCLLLESVLVLAIQLCE